MRRLWFIGKKLSASSLSSIHNYPDENKMTKTIVSALFIAALAPSVFASDVSWYQTMRVNVVRLSTQPHTTVKENKQHNNKICIKRRKNEIQEVWGWRSFTLHVRILWLWHAEVACRIVVACCWWMFWSWTAIGLMTREQNGKSFPKQFSVPPLF